MHVSPEEPKELKDVVDVGLEVEGSCRARHEAGVLPFGDIDLIVRQEVADRAAQQRREVSGHGCHHQDLGVAQTAPTRHLALEMNEMAKGLGNQGALSDGNLAALHLSIVDTPSRFPVAPRRALEQLERGRRAAAKRRVIGGIERIAKHEAIGLRRGPRRPKRRLIQLVEMVQHESTLPSVPTLHVNAASRNQMVILCCGAMTGCRGG